MSEISQYLLLNQHKIEILQKGETGTPIIILTGMGCSFDEWHDISESLSKSNRVVMFHRPGLGNSEIRNEVRNTQAVVNEISEMISLLKLTEPVILVGHSYGGLCAQHFVKAHPEKVAGIVLVDSTSVDVKVLDELDLPMLNEDSTDDIWMEKCHLYSLMKKEELTEIINPTLTKKQEQLPFDIQQRLIDFQVNPNLYKAMSSEISNWKKDAEIIKRLGQFPDIPLIVIGRDKEHSIRMGIEDGFPEWELRLFEEKWQELIVNQATLTQNSKLIVVQEASHSIHVDRPDIIIESITEIVRKIKC
ncbi:alpha/beta hydrolase [Sporosarcina sp. YIM B06819]|uniref:alpha/beta hydrolase n=1 Tax=Sporosarcina sp. YIM B06819 TaxID=3081769 RepID=UPI00298D5065|nr:alpha/beta hydrolase [Sporosarcina sp. YIM B06819]